MNSAKPPNHRDTHAGGPMVLHTRVVTGTGGGPEKTILNSPRFLERLGYRSRCVFFHPPGDEGIEEIIRRGRDLGTEVIALPDRGPFDWRSLMQVSRLCRAEGAAIWHAHDYKSNILGLLLRRFHPMTLVTTAHGWGAVIGRIPLYNRIDMLAIPRYDKVIGVSEEIVARCRAAGTPPEDLVLIENAIDLEQYERSATRHSARDRLGLPREAVLVGAVGRLSREKGFDRLVKAVARIRRGGRLVALVIAGEGPDRGRLEQLISQENAVHFVHLLGHRSEINSLYDAIDLFAISSSSEGLPNVLLEAMAMELPVVATRVGGIPRLITDGETGLLVEPGDITGLTGAIKRLITAPRMARGLAAAGGRLIAQRYSFAQRMERIAGCYQSLGVHPPRDGQRET